MSFRQVTAIALVVLAFFLGGAVNAGAEVTVFFLDTSGSMRGHGFEEAKEALIHRVEAAEPGDVLYVGRFDVSEALVGRLAVAEHGSEQEKQALIDRIEDLEANGEWTNLDLPVKAGKALLLEERAPGTRRIVILSDGLSDPAPGFEPVDLATMAEILPQRLGVSLYLIGLPGDIAGLFQVDTGRSPIVHSPDEPHIKGIPVAAFTSAGIQQGLDISQADPVEQPLTPEPSSGSTANLDWLHGFAGAVVSALLVPGDFAPEVPFLPLAALAAVVAGIVGTLVWMRHRPRLVRRLALEVRETGQAQAHMVEIRLQDGDSTTVGPRGDVVVGSKDPTPVFFTIRFRKGRLLLIPQDRVTVNGDPVDTATSVTPGDAINVRDMVHIILDEGGIDHG